MNSSTYKFILFSFILFAGVQINGFAQCDTIAAICEKNMSTQFLSDGQEYRALLMEEQTAEFNITLYGKSEYRFAACSGLDQSNLLFTVFDKDRNEIFSNKNYDNAPYWDFKVNNTLDVLIEATLNTDNLGSGCAVLLVGFKP
tara:strand:+ start:607 stop:1035 length:429 start_codon:yes stop_codon:yes gene_type:complete